MAPIHSPGAAPLEPRRGWWSRNWKWFVPAGCLSLILLVLAFVFAIVLLVFGALKSTDVYRTALSAAQNNPAVVEALGAPIEEGWFLSGKANVEGSSGEADFSIPISGPKGKGTIYVVAQKSAGRWDFKTLEVEVHATKERIDVAPTMTLETDPDTDSGESSIREVC
jgi:hypothetical protein